MAGRMDKSQYVVQKSQKRQRINRMREVKCPKNFLYRNFKFLTNVQVLGYQNLLILDQGFFNLCNMMDAKVTPEKNFLKSCLLGKIGHSICVLISQDPSILRKGFFFKKTSEDEKS